MRVPSAGLWLDLAPSEVVRRELLREVGGAAADLRFVGQFYASGGISGDVAYVDLATGVASPDCCWSGTWAGHTANPPGVLASSRRGLVEIRLVPVAEALRVAIEILIAHGPSAPTLLW
jgi:hypothetical protein